MSPFAPCKAQQASLRAPPHVHPLPKPVRRGHPGGSRHPPAVSGLQLRRFGGAGDREREKRPPLIPRCLHACLGITSSWGVLGGENRGARGRPERSPRGASPAEQPRFPVINPSQAAVGAPQTPKPCPRGTAEDTPPSPGAQPRAQVYNSNEVLRGAGLPPRTPWLSGDTPGTGGDPGTQQPPGKDGCCGVRQRESRRGADR